MYASFLKIRAPCIWSFLLCRLTEDFLGIINYIRIFWTQIHPVRLNILRLVYISYNSRKKVQCDGSYILPNGVNADNQDFKYEELNIKIDKIIVSVYL